MAKIDPIKRRDIRYTSIKNPSGESKDYPLDKNNRPIIVTDVDGDDVEVTGISHSKGPNKCKITQDDVKGEFKPHDKGSYVNTNNKVWTKKSNLLRRFGKFLGVIND